jgi:ribosomal protein L31
MPMIYVALENIQEDCQSHMIEVEVKIDNHPIYTLIEFGSIHRYIDSKIVEKFKLKCKHVKSWLAQLATRTKKKINGLVNNC